MILHLTKMETHTDIYNRSIQEFGNFNEESRDTVLDFEPFIWNLRVAKSVIKS